MGSFRIYSHVDPAMANPALDHGRCTLVFLNTFNPVYVRVFINSTASTN